MSFAAPLISLPSSVLEWKELDHGMPTKRCRCGSAMVKGQFVVVGGHIGSTILNSVEMYNPDTGSWSSLPPMEVKRDGCAVTSIGEDMLIVVGGYDGNTYLNSVECFSFAAQRWSFLPNMSKRRWGCAAVAVGNQVFVVGGNDGHSTTLSSGEVLNIDTGYWTLIANMNMKREGCALVAMNDQQLFAIGGYGNHYLNSCEVYNISSDTWTFSASMSLSRSYCAAVALDDREILVMGGQHGRRGGHSTCLNSTEVFSLETRRWTASLTPAMLTRRRGCTAGLLPGKVVVVAGGSSDGISSLASVEQLVVDDARIPSPPQLPPFPTTITQLSPKRVSLGSIRRWIDRVTQMKENYKETIAAATVQYNRELCDQKAVLEEEIRKVEREHNHKIETMDAVAQPWFTRVDSQLEEAQDHLLQKQLALNDNEEDDLLTAIPPDYTKMIMLKHRPQEPPPELQCPITLELMEDPVVAADGHTYERFAIEKVFDQQLQQSRQQLRSPKTGQVLLTRTLFPNVAIRSLCQEFQQAAKQIGRSPSRDADDASTTDISTARSVIRRKKTTYEAIPF